jgi:hypothetical protein
MGRLNSLAGRDGALTGVNLNNRTRRDHGVQSTVELPDDASPVGRQRRAILCRQKGSLIRRLIETERIWKQILCPLPQRPFRQQHGRIRTGKLPQGQGLSISRIYGTYQSLDGEIVDVGEDDESVNGKFVFFAFQAVQPARSSLK